MGEVLSVLKHLDYSPLWISLKTGVIATVICFVLGIFCAYRVYRMKSKMALIVDGLLTMPMVLPPTVAGFFLLLLFSRRRPVGNWLFVHFDVKIVQTFTGCVLAAAVIAFPLMYQNAKAAFEQVDKNLVDAARTLGMQERTILWKVLIPNAAPGIWAGTILTFARSLGEYGATSMLAGNIAGKTGTISQKIAMVIQNGDYLTAGIWTGIILLISFVILIFMNLLAGKKK